MTKKKLSIIIEAENKFSKAIEQASNDLAALKKQANETDKALKGSEESLDSLGQSAKETASDTNKAGDALGGLGNDSKKLANDTNKASDALDELGNSAKKSANETKSASNSIGDFSSITEGATASLMSFSTLAAGGALVAVGGLAVGFAGIGAAAWSAATDSKNAMNELSASLGITGEALQTLHDEAIQTYKMGFGESIQEASKLIADIDKQIGSMASQDTFNDIAADVFALNETFEADTPKVIDSLRALMSNFGLTSEQALDFITTGFQQGLNASDDFLDSVNEYSVQFADAGASASEFYSTMQTGMQTGMLGTDKAADMFKEFTLRIQDGSTLTSEALAKMFGTTGYSLDVTGDIDQVSASLDNAKKKLEVANQKQLELIRNGKGALSQGIANQQKIDELTADINAYENALASLNGQQGTYIEGTKGAIDYAGGLQGFMSDLNSGVISQADAFSILNDAISGIEDPAQRMTVGVALMGTQFEDLTATGAAAIDLTATSMDDLAGSTDKLSIRYDSLGRVGEVLKRRLTTSLIPVGDAMLDIANDAMPFVMDKFDQFESIAVPFLNDRLVPAIRTAGSFLLTTIPNAITKTVTVFDKAKASFVAGFDFIKDAFNLDELFAGGIKLPKLDFKMSGGGLSAIGGGFAALQPIIGNLTPTIDFLKQGVDTLQQSFLTFQQSAMTTWDNIQPSIVIFGKTMVGVFDLVRASFVPFIAGVQSGFATFIENLQPAMPAIQSLADTFMTHLPTIVTGLTAVAGAITLAFGAIGITAIQGFMQLISTSLPIFGTLLAGILTSISGILGGVIEVVSSTFSLIQSIVLGDSEATNQALESIWLGLQTIFINAFSGLLTIVTSSLQLLGNAFTTAYDFINNLTGNALNKMVVNTLNKMNGIVVGISTAGQTLLSSWTGSWDNLTSLTSDFVASIYDNTIGDLSEMVANIATLMVTFEDTMLDSFDSTIQSVRDTLYEFIDIGSEIVTNIVDGIIAAKDKVKSVLLNIIQEAIGSLTSFLGTGGGGGGDTPSSMQSTSRTPISDAISKTGTVLSAISSVGDGSTPISDIINKQATQIAAIQSVDSDMTGLQDSLRRMQKAWQQGLKNGSEMVNTLDSDLITSLLPTNTETAMTAISTMPFRASQPQSPLLQSMQAMGQSQPQSLLLQSMQAMGQSRLINNVSSPTITPSLGDFTPLINMSVPSQNLPNITSQSPLGNAINPLVANTTPTSINRNTSQTSVFNQLAGQGNTVQNDFSRNTDTSLVREYMREQVNNQQMSTNTIEGSQSLSTPITLNINFTGDVNINNGQDVDSLSRQIADEVTNVVSQRMGRNLRRYSLG